MIDVESLLLPMEQQMLKSIESDISLFISKWNDKKNLKHIAMPTGDGIPDDVIAIDYCIYEGVLGSFFNSISKFLYYGAILLGNFLVSSTGFQWNQIRINNQKTLCLKHKECSLIVPIQEMALFRYSGRPQYNTFETLHFDILFSEAAVENTHPLIDASQDALPGNKTFKERHGYEIPIDVLELYILYSSPDVEFLLRQIGLQAYSCCMLRDWERLKSIISLTDFALKEYYGEDWQERFREDK